MARRVFGGIRRLPSKRYQAFYTGPDGTRHLAPSTFVRKGDAEGWLNAEELLIDRDEWTAPEHRAKALRVNDLPKLGDWAETCIKRRETRSRNPLKPRTADGYRQLVRLTFGPIAKVRLDQLTPRVISAWYDNLNADTPTQRANAYGLLHSVLGDAVHDDLIKANPAKIRGAGKPAPARQGIALTTGQLLAYLDAVAEVKRPRDLPTAQDRRMALMLAAWCSLRSGEVRGLRRRDVADDGSEVRIEQAVTRLGGPGQDKSWHFDTPKTIAGRRTVAVPSVVDKILAAYLVAWDERYGNKPDRLLFAAANHVDPLNDSVLRKAHARGAKAIGVEGLTVHDLRRTGATLAGQSGATIRELMRRLGHTQPQIAMIYQVADDARDRELAARMGMKAITASSGNEADDEQPHEQPDPAPAWRPWGLVVVPRGRMRLEEPPESPAHD